MIPLLRSGGLEQMRCGGFLAGFLFWVAFLLVLEPDNVLRAIQAGYPLSLKHEVVRILGAAAIGGAATPLVLYMTQSHPLDGTRRWRNALSHVVTIAGLAAALIVISCFAAAWAFGHRLWPTGGELRQELVGNFTLLMFALTSLTLIVHLISNQRVTSPRPKAAVEDEPLNRVLVMNRGRREWIAIADVDWIESQGNYVLLHGGGRARWVRETLSAFVARLDATRFVRIHRRTVVALDRIREMVAEGNGDASVRLTDGTTLRASRKYRQGLHDRWLGFGSQRIRSTDDRKARATDG